MSGWVDAVSIAVAPDGYPRIAYSDGGLGGFCFAQKSAGGWTTGPEIGAKLPNGLLELAVDSDGDPHIISNSLSSGTHWPYYHWREGGSWFDELIDSGSSHAGAITVDAQGGVHTAYYINANGRFEVRYAYRQEPTGLPLSEAGSAELKVTPNPARGGQTEIAYRLAAPAAANLAVFDIAGRLVRELDFSRSDAVTSRTVAWNGRDADGRAVAPGVYFVRLQANGNKAASKKVTILR